MQEEISTQSQTNVTAENEFEIPPECCVVFYNDNITTMGFVVDVLKQFFAKEEEEAVQLMGKIHNEGSAVVGIYTYDIANTRAQMTVQAAKKNGFPLKVEVKR